MTPLETLKAARALIADRSRWTQGVFARNARGSKVSVASEEATCFCSVGALIRVDPSITTRLYHFAPAYGPLRRASLELFEIHPATSNDQQTHTDVVTMFDRAIELAGAEGS